MPFDLMAVAEGAKPKLGSKLKDRASKTPSCSSSNDSARLSGVDAMAEQMAAMKKLDSLRAVSKPNRSKAPAVPQPTAAAPAKERAPAPATRRTKDGDWICGTCSRRNNADADGDCTVPASFKFCPSCGESDTGVPCRKKPPKGMTSEWECHCGEACAASFLFCVECGLAAGAAKPPPPGVCGGCDEAMPETWKFCPDCSTEAGEWDSGAKARIAGLPAPCGEDWPCSKCSDDMPGSFRFCPECGSGSSA
jgi:membrane protease subunit (stomatin/prohibitin family)